MINKLLIQKKYTSSIGQGISTKPDAQDTSTKPFISVILNVIDLIYPPKHYSNISSEIDPLKNTESQQSLCKVNLVKIHTHLQRVRSTILLL